MTEIQWGSPQPRLKWWQRLLPRSRRPTPTHRPGVTVTTFEESGVEMVRVTCHMRSLDGIHDDTNSTKTAATREATK